MEHFITERGAREKRFRRAACRALLGPTGACQPTGSLLSGVGPVSEFEILRARSSPRWRARELRDDFFFLKNTQILESIQTHRAGSRSWIGRAKSAGIWYLLGFLLVAFIKET